RSPDAAPTASTAETRGRADSAGRENPLAAAGAAPRAGLAPAHAGGTTAVELDRLDEAAELQPQVRPAQRGVEEARRRPAPAALLRDVVVGRTFVVADVELVDRLDAGLRGGVRERLQQWPAPARAV